MPGGPDDGGSRREPPSDTEGKKTIVGAPPDPRAANLPDPPGLDSRAQHPTRHPLSSAPDSRGPIQGADGGRGRHTTLARPTFPQTRDGPVEGGDPPGTPPPQYGPRSQAPPRQAGSGPPPPGEHSSRPPPSPDRWLPAVSITAPRHPGAGSTPGTQPCPRSTRPWLSPPASPLTSASRDTQTCGSVTVPLPDVTEPQACPPGPLVAHLGTSAPRGAPLGRRPGGSTRTPTGAVWRPHPHGQSNA